ncbi:unnamed protein product, partial [Didymodactylos carnosus]
KQHHEGEAEQEHAQRLLDQHRAGVEGEGDRREGRQVGVDGQRPDHAQAGQQQCQQNIHERRIVR